MNILMTQILLSIDVGYSSYIYLYCLQFLSPMLCPLQVYTPFTFLVKFTPIYLVSCYYKQNWFSDFPSADLCMLMLCPAALLKPLCMVSTVNLRNECGGFLHLGSRHLQTASLLQLQCGVFYFLFWFIVSLVLPMLFLNGNCGRGCLGIAQVLEEMF